MSTPKAVPEEEKNVIDGTPINTRWITDLKCPSCGHTTLFLANGNYITCSCVDCQNPDYKAALSAKEENTRQATIKEVVERLKREGFDDLYQPSISDLELDEYQGKEKPVIYLDQANAQWRAALKKIEEEML